jgi:L-galactose dehydrogenase/L-glyceraldehyde 3-phosphate reductase
MKYRTLGKTGLRVSEIGFGCGNIGGLMVRAPLAERLAAVKRALELGINYFDTAAAYGNGQSEKNLGEVLATIPPKVTVATKFAITGNDVRDVQGTIRKSLENSLKSLRRNSVDIFQLHTPLAAEDRVSSRNIGLKSVLGAGGVADALDNLRSEGLVRFIGLTGLGETAALHQIIESQRFDLVQTYYNLINPSAAFSVPPDFSSQNFAGLIKKAGQNRMGVAAIRVLAGGALGGASARTGYASPSVGGALVPGSEYEVDRRRAAKLSFLVKGDVANLSQAGIRFILGEPHVSAVLVGFSNLSQIEEATAWSDRGPLPQSDLDQLQKLWDSDFNPE